MTARERTRQQLDPAGSSGLRAVTISLGIGAFGYALVMTARGIPEISHPVFAVLALIVLAAACVILIIASSPYRAPLTSRIHFLAHVLALGAIVLEAAGQWGTNAYIRDDWGPICLGIILVSLGPYRPAREIASAGVLSAIFIGFLVLLQVDGLITKGPPIAFVVLAVTPMLALCFSAAMFSRGIVESLQRWQHRASEASQSLVTQMRDGIARAVQQDRVSIVNRDVLPFFAGVLATGEITDEDRIRARSIADSIRGVMVEEVDRSWLENMIEPAGDTEPKDAGAAKVVVNDPERLAPRMIGDQRTAVRALLAALVESPHFDRSAVRIVLSRDDGDCHGRITAELDVADHVARSELAPYFALLGAVFANLDVGFAQSTLTLRFSYEHR